MSASLDVVVVGSLNQDLVAQVDRIPAPGETVLASGHGAFAGGKGANQATAAARLGAKVAIVGRVGRDAAGESLIAGLSREGIDISHLIEDEEAGTGLALINVDVAGENAITVSPGANGKVSVADVEGAADMIASAAVVLLQLEVPIAPVAAAAHIARGKVVLNPAPAMSLPSELLEDIDFLVPNESELAMLAGADLGSDEAVAEAARQLAAGGVVVTLGGRGAMTVTRSSASLIPSIDVEVVDTTGAGDTFCGAFAAELARGAYLQPAARFAVRAAGVAVTKLGAQEAMPTRGDLT